MLLERLRVIQKAALKIVSTLAPVKESKQIVLEFADLAIAEPKYSSIDFFFGFDESQTSELDIPFLTPPELTKSLCFDPSELWNTEPFPFKATVVDLTEWINAQLESLLIVFFSVDLVKPLGAGKSYDKDLEDGVQNQEPKNGKTKSSDETRNFSSRATRKQKEKSASLADVFDLIYPILQPPLGEAFDNLLILAEPLKPWQVEGVRFLLEHEQALLADDMGLGKTIQAIVALRLLFHQGRVVSTLIVCPKSILRNWNKELWKWSPELQVVMIRGTKDQREFLWSLPAHVYLTTYETLRQDLPFSLAGMNDDVKYRDPARKVYDGLILDEAQKIKNSSSDLSRAVRHIKAKFRWALSGTPLENRVEDLITIFSHLKPGLLRLDEATDIAKIKSTIRDSFLRRRAEGLPGLPAVEHLNVWLDLSSDQRIAYDHAEKDGIVFLNEQGESATVQHVLALITKLKQICNIDPVSQESSKLDYLKERLEQITEQEDKALVFSQYPEKTLRFISEQLIDYQPVVFDGSLSDQKRDAIVTEFQEREEIKVLLMSVKAGGVGLTLTRASHVFHFDHWWNPATAAQAEARVRRLGQKKSTVFVTSLLTTETIEERIHEMLESKKAIFQAIVDDMSDAGLTKVLSEDELFGLFGLQKRRTPKPDASATSKAFREMGDLSPDEFEELVAMLYQKMGYNVRVTQKTRDGGVDVYAKRTTEGGTEYLAIQCKHYPNGTVGDRFARELYGVIASDQSITRGVLITSGSFSEDCRRFARDKRLDLFDNTYLRGLLTRYELP